MNQRWREGRDSYRPDGEPINTSLYGCRVVRERVAKQFVCKEHYSHAFPAAVLSVGLFRKAPFLPEELVGVAVFSVPMQQKVIPAYFPESDPNDGVELGRFVLLDDVPANGETWFLKRAFRLLKEEKGKKCVVSYSDPMERRTSSGVLVKPGHFGTIYQAFNGRFLGRARGRTLVLAPSGTVVSERSISKLRNAEKGADYVYRQFIELGAPKRKPLEGDREYVQRAVSESFTKVRHPGNLVYGWPLRRGVKTKNQLPYPKARDFERRQQCLF